MHEQLLVLNNIAYAAQSYSGWPPVGATDWQAILLHKAKKWSIVFVLRNIREILCEQGHILGGSN